MTKLQSSTILITRLREKYKNTNKTELKLAGAVYADKYIFNALNSGWRR